MKKKWKKFAIMLNGRFVMNSSAVSAEKAINNARYRMYQKEGSWYNVPSFEKFDAVEL